MDLYFNGLGWAFPNDKSLQSLLLAVCSQWFRVLRQNFLLSGARQTDTVTWFIASGQAQNQRGWMGSAKGERWPPVCGISWNMAERPHACLCTQWDRVFCPYVSACVCVWVDFFLFRHASTENSFFLTSAFPHLTFFSSTQVLLHEIKTHLVKLKKPTRFLCAPCVYQSDRVLF